MRRPKSHWPKPDAYRLGAPERLEDQYSTTSLYDLSPCPICGGSPEIKSWQSFNGRIFVLNCIVKCWQKDHASAGPFGTLDEARAAWNMQAVLVRKEPEVEPDPGFPTQDFSACFDDAEDLDE